MVKNITYVLLICLFLVGCSSGASGTKSNLSMDSFIKAFESEGVEVDPDEKPMFSLIGAKDGIIVYNDGKPVKIYEFSSKKDIDKAEEELPAMKDWERNGLFVLETSDEKSIEIFKNVK